MSTKSEVPKAIDVLAERFPFHSIPTLRAFIEAGGVRLFGKRIATNTLVEEEKALEVVEPLPPPDYHPLPIPFQVLFEDDHLLVIDKPQGVSVLPGRGGERTLLQGILHHNQGRYRPHVVHRLDRQTSGVMVVAKHKRAAALLSKAFEKREVQKEYLAFVQGVPHPEKGSITLPIRLPQSRKPKPSETEYELLEHYGRFSLLLVRPKTGRMHQIRIHLQAIGHPLLVDPVYGGQKAFYLSQIKAFYKKKKGEEERPLISRLTLHSFRLGFPHPHTGEWQVWEAPLPKDLQILQQKLRKYGKGKA